MYYTAHAAALRPLHIYHSTSSHSSSSFSWPVVLIVLGFLLVSYLVMRLIRR